MPLSFFNMGKDPNIGTDFRFIALHPIAIPGVLGVSNTNTQITTHA
jgi:hypothetical protein